MPLTFPDYGLENFREHGHTGILVLENDGEYEDVRNDQVYLALDETFADHRDKSVRVFRTEKIYHLGIKAKGIAIILSLLVDPSAASIGEYVHPSSFKAFSAFGNLESITLQEYGPRYGARWPRTFEYRENMWLTGWADMRDQEMVFWERTA